MTPVVDPALRPAEEWVARMRAAYPVEPFVDHALTRKLRTRPNGRYAPLTLESAGQQLEKFLQSRLGSDFDIRDLKLLSGGNSKEQYAFRLLWRDGVEARDERLVLRMQPAQSIVETHRLREFQILQAMDGVVPVPAPLWIDAEAEYFQQPALIYRFCSGVSRPSEADAPGAVKGSFGPKWRQILTPQFIANLARIHLFDWSGKDMSAYEIAKPGTTDGVIQVVNFWNRAWEEDRIEAVPLVTLVAQWLRDNAPPVDRISVVHGDYRAGNFLFDPDSGDITAILDWELVHFADRHEDLATLLLPGLGEYDENGTFLVGGFCPRDEFLSRYEEASGLPVDEARLAYYEVYNYWRTLCMSLGSAARCVQLQKTHQDIVLVANTVVAGMMFGDLNNCMTRILSDGA